MFLTGPEIHARAQCTMGIHDGNMAASDCLLVVNTIMAASVYDFPGTSLTMSADSAHGGMIILWSVADGKFT